MTNTGNRFRDLLETTDTFAVTCELIPGRVSHDQKLDNILKFAEKGRDTGLVHAISLTDNPGGGPALSPDELASEIESTGMSALVHFTAKDMNRNMIESRVLALDRMGINNLLVMSGDYQTDGFSGIAMPVFDLDPVHIVTMLSLMNKGWRINHGTHTLEEGSRTNVYHGAVVSPCKCTEPEMMNQLYKMQMKARAGANYFITQLGFDAEKVREFMNWVKSSGLDIPILGSVFILRRGAARAMNRGDIPGAMVTDSLLSGISAEAKADDKGRAASLERAAMQVAVLKGLGFRGAHIEAMILRFDMVETILGRAAELAGSWEECAEKLNYSPAGTFYFSKPDNESCSLMGRKLRNGWLTYRAMRVLHFLFFEKRGFFGGLMRWKTGLLDRIPVLGALVHFGEKMAKMVLFDCRDCGDCALPELLYLCPQSQCPKQQRNAPCGGSWLDSCEVYPERPCVWSRVYARAKPFGELGKISATVIGPRDWALQNTSSWVNFHQNRDHDAYDFTAFFDAPERVDDEGKN